MKNFKINVRRINLLLVTGFILINICSCVKDNNQYKKNNFIAENGDIQYNTSIDENSKTVENFKNKTAIDGNAEEKQDDNNITYSEDDKVVISVFATIKNDIVLFLNSEEVEGAKDKAKGIFISTVDFLFYDAEINGIKFDNLTEEGKKKVLEIVTEVDSYIIKKFPTYKEDISENTKEAYIKASELIKKGTNNIKEFSKEKLGEDNYNSIIEVKDEIVVYTKDAVNIIGDFSSKVLSSAK